LLSRTRDGRPKLFQGFLLDITDRMEAEEKAFRAEERYRLLAEEGPVIAFAVRLAHEPVPSVTLEYLSPQLRDLVGYDIAAWRAEPARWLEIVHPDDRDQMAATFLRSLEHDDDYVDDYRIIAHDGRVVWLHTQARAIEHDEQGRPSLFQGIMLDVTDAREEAQELQASEELYRSFVEGMPAIPWVESVDPLTGAGRMTFIGPQTREWFGWSAEELLAEPDHLERMVHPEDRERVMAYWREVETSGASEWRISYRMVARDGRVIPLLSHGTPLRDEEGRIRAWYGFAVSLDRTGLGPVREADLAGESGFTFPA
jgi:PAS domain S-box-containing protein